jgi:nucleoside-diphosphate-sugar epimerase
MRKTILLSGATGYLGSRLLKALINDYNIIITKRSFSNTGRIQSLLGRCKTYDIDRTPVEVLFKENLIDIILNTAGNYGRKNEPLIEIVASNIVFPINLLDCALKYNVKYFIHTDSVLNKYTNPYTLSKTQFSEWLKHVSEKLSILNIKLEHFYGPGDDSSKFIGYVINKILNKEKEIRLTFGEQKRDFIYIDDVVNFFDLILKSINRYETGFHEFHIGTGVSHRIRDMVEYIKKISGSNINLLFGEVPYRKHEIMDSKANAVLLEKMGYHISIDIFSGLKKTWEIEKKQDIGHIEHE